jgi:hypothetical protein
VVSRYCKRRNVPICFPRLAWYDETRTAENSYQAFRSQSRSFAAKFECKAADVCRGARKEAQSAPKQVDTSRFFSDRHRLLVARSLSRRNIRYVSRAAARRGIGRPTSRRRLPISSINAPGWQAPAVHGFFQNPRDLLRERAMLGCGPAPQRFFQMIRDVRANEHSLTICHLLSVSPSDRLRTTVRLSPAALQYAWPRVPCNLRAGL